MLIKSLLGQARRSALARWRQKKLPLDASAPIVTFTFDDFPRSAYETGGAILRSYGARGTYYAAMGLQGKINHQGEHFLPEDFEHLLADGHDLGSHTYSHISSRRSKLGTFCADAERGERALDPWRDASRAGHFAYPYGEITFSAKARIGSSMRSCRSIMPGIMTSSADLNMLPANSIYACDFDPQLIERMLSPTQLRRGWVIFYTHDVRENPSAFGCTPRQLEFVLRQAIKVLGARVMTMSEAVETLIRDSAEECSNRTVIPDRDAIVKPS
jgi:peptidoglycan/xylan/chitin deacetylase (PgdA/CDA1 family)